MQQSARPNAPVGFLDALRDGMIVGWARDPQDAAAVAQVRLMRGIEVLAEGPANIQRDDGMPGFRIRPTVPVTATDLLEGRVRVRVLLPGRQAPFTLAMTLRMRAALEAEAGWEPTTDIPPPPPPAPQAAPEPSPEPARRAAPVPPRPAPSASRPPDAPDEARPPAAPADTILGIAEPPTAPRQAEALPDPEPPPTPPPAPPVEAAPEAAPPPPAPPPGPTSIPPLLGPLAALAAAADGAGIPVLHLVLPDRVAVVAPDPAGRFAQLEAAAATLPLVARDWVPLRAAFARDPNPGPIWRRDGRSLSVDGGAALLRTLLAVLRARMPRDSHALARAEAMLGRADLAALPRRDVPDHDNTDAAFLGVPLHETEPALTEAIFFDLPAPRSLAGVSGIEAWHSPAAPLPWRVLLLTSPGLGGSTGPSMLGWWLRHLAAECVISEALPTAPPAAALALQPGLILTLSAD